MVANRTHIHFNSFYQYLNWVLKQEPTLIDRWLLRLTNNTLITKYNNLFCKYKLLQFVMSLCLDHSMIYNKFTIRLSN